MRDRVTFVIHDWGSALGFDWANRHRESVKGIAFMEAIVRPQGWDHWDKIHMRPALQALRSEAGEAMVLRDNFFIEKILPSAILRTLILANDEDLAFIRRLPALTEVTVAGRHYVQEDSPNEIGRAIAGWIRGAAMNVHPPYPLAAAR